MLQGPQKKIVYLISFLILTDACIHMYGCGEKLKESSAESANSKKRPEVIYPEVKIGRQIWMKKNLDVVTFRNGDTITEARSESDWETAGLEHKPAWCYYENDSKFGSQFGKLYNWYAVSDPRGLAPEGWHIPHDSEWVSLINFLDGRRIAGLKLKSDSGWIENGNGNNQSKFDGLPAGYRYYLGDFSSMGKYGLFWTSTESDADFGIYHYLSYNTAEIKAERDAKSDGFSVRCIKD